MRSIRQNLATLTRQKRKLTDEKVKQIREQHAAGKTQRELAEEHHVARSTISGIVGRISWRDVQ